MVILYLSNVVNIRIHYYVCKLAKVDYMNYDLGEDNYDNLVGIAIELTYQMAEKYEIDLIGE